VAVFPFLGYAYLSGIGAITEAAQASHVGFFLAMWWLVIIWWTVSSTWMQYYLEMWIVTNRRIVSTEQKGLFYREVTGWSIERVQEVNVQQANILQALLDYGMLEIHTPGMSDEHERVFGIPHPGAIREVIMAAASQIAPLQAANENQEKLIHTISHEVKSYLTKDAASLSSIAEGDAGNAPPEVRSFAKHALSETRKGVSAVMDILKDTDAKTGILEMSDAVFDLSADLFALYSEFKPEADKKGLSMTFSSESGACKVCGDEKKLMDLVFRNVLDNSLHYTQTGSIKINLSKSPSSVICTVTDTGVGISEADIAKLFTEGGHGKHSTDITLTLQATDSLRPRIWSRLMAAPSMPSPVVPARARLLWLHCH